MRGIGIAAVVLFALALPASAQSPVIYEGRTSQGLGTKIFATPEGDITEIRMGWRARCRRSGVRFRTRTKWLDPIEQSGTQVTDSGTYRMRMRRRIRVIIRGELSGTFESGRGGEGTARYSVRVRRRGRLIDRCRSGPISWSVTRAG